MSNPGPFDAYAFVSLGANLPSVVGEPLETLAFAFSCLAELSACPLLRSSIYLSRPVDSPPGTPDFYNAMAALLPRKGENGHSLLAKLQAIENRAGRSRNGIRNEARTLDLDLICFAGETRDTPALSLPHPRTAERGFVLVPLVELIGKAGLPGFNRPPHELLRNVDASGVVTIDP